MKVCQLIELAVFLRTLGKIEANERVKLCYNITILTKEMIFMNLLAYLMDLLFVLTMVTPLSVAGFVDSRLLVAKEAKMDNIVAIRKSSVHKMRITLLIGAIVLTIAVSFAFLHFAKVLDWPLVNVLPKTGW